MGAPQDQVLAKDPLLDRGILEALSAVDGDEERQKRLDTQILSLKLLVILSFDFSGFMQALW